VGRSGAVQRPTGAVDPDRDRLPVVPLRPLVEQGTRAYATPHGREVHRADFEVLGPPGEARGEVAAGGADAMEEQERLTVAVTA
jgi:hypothetical protein